MRVRVRVQGPRSRVRGLLHREQRLVALVEARGERDHDVALLLQQRLVPVHLVRGRVRARGRVRVRALYRCTWFGFGVELGLGLGFG